jgi:hypothetical protein
MYQIEWRMLHVPHEIFTSHQLIIIMCVPRQEAGGARASC